MSIIEELRSGHPDIQKLLSLCLQENPECRQRAESDNSLPLHSACRNVRVLSMPEVILALVEAYPEAVELPNNFGLLPLHKAASVANAGHIPALTILIEANPLALCFKTIDGQTPLHFAISGPRRPSSEVVDFFCSINAEVAVAADSYGQLPMHKAAARSRIEVDVVNSLIKANPYALSMKDSKGYVKFSFFFFHTYLLSDCNECSIPMTLVGFYLFIGYCAGRIRI